MRRTNLPLLLAFGVLAACTAKNEGPGFDTEVPGSTEDAGGAAAPDAGTDDARREAERRRGRRRDHAADQAPLESCASGGQRRRRDCRSRRRGRHLQRQRWRDRAARGHHRGPQRRARHGVDAACAATSHVVPDDRRVRPAVGDAARERSLHLRGAGAPLGIGPEADELRREPRRVLRPRPGRAT